MQMTFHRQLIIRVLTGVCVCVGGGGNHHVVVLSKVDYPGRISSLRYIFSFVKNMMVFLCPLSNI